MLIIVGAARSGFGYITKVIQNALSKDVLHERYGRDGIAAWWIPDRQGDKKYTANVGRAQNKTFIHQVRYPLYSISSNVPRVKRQWQAVPWCHSDDSDIVKAAKCWLWYNEKAEGFPVQARWQVEELFHGYLMELCGILDVVYTERIHNLARTVSKTTNSSYRCGNSTKRYDTRLTWDQLLEECGYDLGSKIALKSKEYGYDKYEFPL